MFVSVAKGRLKHREEKLKMSIKLFINNLNAEDLTMLVVSLWLSRRLL